MALKRERKEDLVEQYTQLLRDSQGVVLTEYRGLSNQQLTKLRRAIRDANGAYHVTKVTLLRRALEETGYSIPDDLGGAPIGVGFALEEMPALAKALRDFAKSEDLFTLRGAIMGESVMTTAQVEKLADLPSIDVLRSEILGLLDSSAANLVGVLQSGMSQVVNVIEAYLQEKGAGSDASASADAQPEAVAEAVAEPVAEAAPEAEAPADAEASTDAAESE